MVVVEFAVRIVSKTLLHSFQKLCGVCTPSGAAAALCLLYSRDVLLTQSAGRCSSRAM